MKLINKDVEQNGHELKQEVQIDPEFDAHRNKFIEMITEFGFVLEGHLGHISHTENHM